MDEVNQGFNQTGNTSNQPQSPASSGSGDISKTTITVLVLLTLMISVIGTWTVLNEVSNAHVAKTSTAVGQVSLTVTAPPQQPRPVDATGRVALNIVDEN